MALTTDAPTAPAAEVAPLLDPQRTYELDRTHVFHSWSAQATLDPMTITASRGSYLWDGDGEQLLDFSSTPDAGSSEPQ